MEDYNFWQDFFDTYQSLSDWIKTLWFIGPLAFVLVLIALRMRYRLALKKAENGISGDLVYSIHRDEFDQPHVYRHGREFGQQPMVLLIEQPNNQPVKPQYPNSSSKAV